MALNPLVTLATSVAARPGQLAVLVGAGVSRDAGAPTAWQVMVRLARQAYAAEHHAVAPSDAGVAEPSTEELLDWLSGKGLADPTYSDVLELLAPSEVARRDVITGQLEGHLPGKAHRALARMVAAGHIRVVVTTNFDQLLGTALRGEGVKPTIVSSAAELRATRHFMHHDCFVLKVHGDYMSDAIRNTTVELSTLEPQMDAVVREVVENHHLLVIGYAGNDPAIARILEGRQQRTRFGMWWTTFDGLTDSALRFVPDPAMQEVRTPNGAGAFLAELERGLAAQEMFPAGRTPAGVHDEIVLLLRRGDLVGVSELQRRAQEDLEEAMWHLRARPAPHPEASAAGPEGGEGPGEVPAAHLTVADVVRPALQVRLGTLLPLVEHDVELLATEIDRICDAAAASVDANSHEGRVALQVAGWLGTMVALVALARRRWSALAVPLCAWIVSRRERRPLLDDLVADLLEITGQGLVGRQPREVSGALVRQVLDVDLLRSRAREVSRDEEVASRALGELDLLAAISRCFRDRRSMAYWPELGDAADNLAARAARDRRISDGIVVACGTGSLEALVNALDRTDDLSGDQRPTQRVSPLVGSRSYLHAFESLRTAGRG